VEKEAKKELVIREKNCKKNSEMQGEV